MKRWLILAARLCCVGLVIVAGLWAMESYTAMLRSFPSSPPAKAKDVPVLEQLVKASLPEGGWQLAGQSFQLRVAAGTPADVDAWLRQRPAAGSSSGPLMPEVRFLFGLGSAEPEKWDGATVLIRQDKDWRAVLFLSDDTPTQRWRQARVAFAGTDGTWTFLEATPADQHPKAATGNRLLPMPEDALLLANRCDETGRVFAQIFQVPRSLPALLAFWRQDGWQAREDEAASAGTCSRNGEVVQFFAPAAQDKEVLLFVMRGQ